ncbi:MAG: helix-turn-helix domain-containing protein [Pseudomonadota bacterium]
MARPSKKDLIMDTAMELYAERGLDGVSLREINAAANLSSSAIRYHFKTRDVLVTELLEGMQPPFFERRQAHLTALHNNTDHTLENVVRALVCPMSDALRDPSNNGLKQLRFLSRLYFDGAAGLGDQFELSWQVFKPLLMPLLSDTPEHYVKLKWLLSSELCLQALANQSMLFKRAGLSDVHQDFDAFEQELINYICAGLRV